VNTHNIYKTEKRVYDALKHLLAGEDDLIDQKSFDITRASDALAVVPVRERTRSTTSNYVSESCLVPVLKNFEAEYTVSILNSRKASRSIY